MGSTFDYGGMVRAPGQGGKTTEQPWHLVCWQSTSGTSEEERGLLLYLSSPTDSKETWRSWEGWNGEDGVGGDGPVSRQEELGR